MRFLFHLLLMLTVALGVGFGLSYLALTDAGRFFGARQVGPWIAWTEAGAPSPDPYTLAYIARNGALQLGRGEGIQFVAQTDSDGQPLDRDCTYRIDGRTPVATFWTLTVTDEDGTVVTRPGTPMTMHSARIARAGDGSAVIRVSKTLAAGNWLELAGDGPFQVVLTIYDSSVFSGLGTELGTMPAILNEGCP